ncbi:MAG: hypothetical protein ACXV3F_01865 [Frankiaceae bacterium]
MPPGMVSGAWERGRAGVDTTPGGSVKERTAPAAPAGPIRQEAPNVLSGTLSQRMTQLRGQGLSSGTLRGIAPREGEAAAPPAPPLPAARRVAGGGSSKGRQLAAQLAREPRVAPKEMVEKHLLKGAALPPCPRVTHALEVKVEGPWTC